jgi:hypothetical protein
MQRLNVSEAHGDAMDIDVGHEAKWGGVDGPSIVRGGDVGVDVG